MSRHPVTKIAGRCAAEGLEAKLDGASRGNRDDPILVGKGRVVDRIVLDIEFLDP
jgi:hypothetical protein